ncbi:Serine/threonine-protein kinase Nek2 [Heterocephalus glaber]|uniref:Serine/threonine-protein kinase Nek2 n=2 Tax=Heterocephalus glaber TaxID=10181 RepID=G5AM46_HETGA|nr:serine/threonine-protein kinase Nek2 isoform X1 [Heterocephalus glaber]EHA98106.1 Serine/threonine-protein kinase Nek2 [Heterocephalus glaber]
MPSRVEDYEVLYTIGTGSYGRCQKIRRKIDGKILVWKELDYGSMIEAEKQMLVSEVNLLRELKHPNIVRYYDRIIDRTNTTLYIVMEYCEGGDLASVITKGTRERQYLDEEFVLRVMTQLTLALKECHRRSDSGHTVLHRDLKPANVFLDGKQNVKLGDFGLARILNHDTSFAKTFVGTPYYMSPEQMNHMSYNEKSDIWSLGCLLYELCALMPPFTAFNQKELAGKIREGKFRRIPYRFSDELNDLITRMLHLKDYHRPSVEEILENPLIADMVTEEQRGQLERRGRRGASAGEPEKPEDSSPALSELRRKELQLQEREQALKAREDMLEQKERELCVRERLAEDKLARAEGLLKSFGLLREQRLLSLASASELLDLPSSSSTIKKKVHFNRDSKENMVRNENSESQLTPKAKCKDLKKRLHAVQLRAQALSDLEKNYQLKSRQILGMR